VKTQDRNEIGEWLSPLLSQPAQNTQITGVACLRFSENHGLGSMMFCLLKSEPRFHTASVESGHRSNA